MSEQEIKVIKSPFAMRENEVKEFDGKDGYASINQVVFKMEMGYINELHLKMLEIVNEFEFVTSKQVYEILKFRGVEIKDQKKAADKLEEMMKSKILSRYYFRSPEGTGIFRIYCLDKIGKYLLNSRSIECNWQPTDNASKTVAQLKKKLSANQAAITMFTRIDKFYEYIPKVLFHAKKMDAKFNINGGLITFKTEDNMQDYFIESVRRNEEWAEKFAAKIQAIDEFLTFFQEGDSSIPRLPKLIIVGEDNQHLAEILKVIKNKNVKVNLKDEDIVYTTDLRTNVKEDSNIQELFTQFYFDAESNKYKMRYYNI